MKFVHLLTFLSYFSTISFAQNIQEDLLDFNKKRNQYRKTGMLTLSSWAVGNITYGSIAYFNSSGEAKYFHRMNVFWNVVNLGIGIPSYLSARNENNEDYGFRKSVEAQHQTELTFLVNSAIDLSYVTTGFILRESAHRFPDNYHEMRGYGSSFVFQGGFLLVFDFFKYVLHKVNAKKRLSPIWDQIEFSQNGLGFQMNF